MVGFKLLYLNVKNPILFNMFIDSIVLSLCLNNVIRNVRIHYALRFKGIDVFEDVGIGLLLYIHSFFVSRNCRK